jgi:hypothetical protein
MAIMMNMSGYEIEREEVAIEEYGDEVMCAGWNPQLALVGDRHVAEMDKHAVFPRELANVDVETFLQKMYKYQC